MFARSLCMQLKPGSVAELTRTVDRQIIPLLRKQKGFQDEITVVVPGGKEALVITLWDQREDAEAYQRESHPAVLTDLAKVVEGTPQLQMYEVANSTFHKIAARVTVARNQQVFVG